MIEFRQTPYEDHQFAGQELTVKREDLAAPAPMPPLAKMRGLYVYLQKRAAEYRRQGVGVLDTRVSKSGLGVAVICEDLEIPCRYYFPVRKGEDYLSAPHRQEAQHHGAQIVPVPAGRMGVVLGRVRIQEPGTLLPLGFPIYETVEAVAQIVAQDGGRRFEGKTVIVPAGTGTILSGIISGLSLLKPEERPAQIYAITASMDPAKVKRHVLEHLSRWSQEKFIPPSEIGDILNGTRIIQQGTDYYAEGTSQADWPTHPYYERKALDWLRRNRPRIRGPVLFWNIGS